jgi:hypothetical protein
MRQPHICGQRSWSLPMPIARLIRCPRLPALASDLTSAKHGAR